MGEKKIVFIPSSLLLMFDSQKLNSSRENKKRSRRDEMRRRSIRQSNIQQNKKRAESSKGLEWARDERKLSGSISVQCIMNIRKKSCCSFLFFLKMKLIQSKGSKGSQGYCFSSSVSFFTAVDLLSSLSLPKRVSKELHLTLKPFSFLFRFGCSHRMVRWEAVLLFTPTDSHLV